MASDKPASTFDKPRHIKYWLRNAILLPEQYTTGDAHRVSYAFFIVAALDLLGLLDDTTHISEAEREGWVKWIYSCQLPSGGFRGFNGTDLGVFRDLWNMKWDPPNLYNTCFALLSLLVLGDDLSGVKREECLKWVSGLQVEDGSFGEMAFEGQMLGGGDLRACYCAVCVVLILHGGRAKERRDIGFDVEGLVRYITNCQSYDGGFGQAAMLEAHSGVNFCGVATLKALDELVGLNGEDSFVRGGQPEMERDVGYMVQRQTTWVEEESDDETEDGHDPERSDGGPDVAEGRLAGPIAGFNGRLGKIADTCYCFWNAGALTLLEQHHLVDPESLRRYLCEKTQHKIGGFSKTPGAVPDLIHAYLGLATLAVYEEPGLKRFDSLLCVSMDARKRLKDIAWRTKT